MGSSNKAQTVGFRYFMGVHIAISHGPVDSVLELIGGETTAWTGNVTANGSIGINQPNLFGGEKREGGWVGTVDVMMGESNQAKNPYLVSKINGPVPAYRGLVSLVFRGAQSAAYNPITGEVRYYTANSFMWSTGNPYFKAPWVRIRRVKKGWSRGNTVWYEAKAQIGRDMNPAHIVYECLTNLEWGMGYSPADIDDASFRAAADTLFDENFGLSLLWMEQATIEDFIKIILNHVDGTVRIDLRTGLFQLRLIRNDYDIDDIPQLTTDEILSVESFQRTAWGDTANEIVVKYTDRNQADATIAVQDLACIEAQGALVSVTREYIGIREGDLAARVATRDLTNVTTPLAKVTLTCNRIAYDWDVTDVFALTWPRLGIDKVAFRIIKINKGTLIEGKITIEAIEDIFGMPTASYVAPADTEWVDPINLPQPALHQRAMEVPYWDIVRTTSAADLAYLEEGYGFGMTMGVIPTSDSFDYSLNASPNNGSYTYVARGSFTPSGVLVSAMPIGPGPISFEIQGVYGVDDIEVGTYAYIDNEAFAITAFNIDTAVITAQRAVLDTVPAAHLAGARIYFPDNANAGYDLTQRTVGETVYYKLLPSTGKGTLDIANAQPLSLAFTQRAERPYPPANVTVSGQYFPTSLFGSVSLNWANRNREQQTVDLVGFTAGNITPEVDQTTTVRLYSGNTLLRTVSGLTTTSWSYSVAQDAADGAVQELRLELESSRDGLASWQRHNITISRHGFGFRFGEEFGGVAS